MVTCADVLLCTLLVFFVLLSFLSCCLLVTCVDVCRRAPYVLSWAGTGWQILCDAAAPQVRLDSSHVAIVEVEKVTKRANFQIFCHQI